MYNLKGLKAVALYRVSTEKQATKDEKDIPAQRELVHNFIENEEMILIREFVESGISGFSVKVKDRDALQKIKEMAKKKEFDVLVVYYSDRIGRSTEESPMVIKYLNDKGIRVFSVKEGELKMQSQIDKLITFINYWQSESEVIKLKTRILDYHILMTKNGKYRGGGEKTVAFGYRLVDRGSVNEKGRKILDFEIDPDRAEIVRLIYNLSIENNMGARAIANYLNERPEYKNLSKEDKGWSYSSITYILNNPIYKGYFHMKSKSTGEEYLSPKLEHLVIIPEERWELNQKVMKERKTTPKKPRTGQTHSRVLLSGLVYCGHCGSKMNVWANYKKYKKKNGEETQYVKDSYRCRSAISNGRIKCEGQTTYSSNKIDSIVEEQTIDFIRELSKNKLTQDFKNKLENNLKQLLKTKNSTEKELIEKQEDIRTLKKELPKALRGESKFTTEELRESLDELKKEVDELLQKLTDIEENILQAKISIEEYRSLDMGLDLWEEKYIKANKLGKRALLAQIIDRVIIYRDSVDIEYKITVNTYKENSEEHQVFGSEIAQLGRAHGYITQPQKFIISLSRKVPFKKVAI